MTTGSHRSTGRSGVLLARLALAVALAGGWSVLAAATPAQAHPVVMEDTAPPDAPADHATATDHATPSDHASTDTSDHASAEPTDHASTDASDHASAEPTDYASTDASDHASAEATDHASAEPTEDVSQEPTGQDTAEPVGAGAPGVSISFAFSVGEPAAGAPVDVSAHALQPGSELSVWIFSTPRLLATTTVDAEGVASVSTTLPGDLAPGTHTVVVKAVGVDGQAVESGSSVTISADGTIEGFSDGADVTGLEVPGNPTNAHEPAFAPVTPLDSPGLVASTSVAALTVATVVGAGIGVSAMRTGPAGSGGGSGGGGLDASVRNRSDDVDDTDDFGGRARPAARVGVVLAAGATSVRRVSPLLSRIMLDAAPLRALVGSVSALLPLAAIVLGVIGGVGVDGKAQPAALGVMIALIVIGVFDSFAGLLGALALSIVVAVTGGIVDLSSVRTLIGVLLIIIGPGLIGSSFRDIRRRRAEGSAALWERLTDLVVVPLLGAWTALAIVKALPDLGGRAFPIAEHAGQIAVVVLVCLVLKVLVEEAAARWAPGRMRAVTLLSDVEPGNTQRTVSALLRTGMFLLVAAAFVGNVWQLWVAAVLFLLPGLLAMLAHRFRNVAALWQALPEGVPLFVVMIVIGLIATAVLTAALGSTPSFAQDAFLVMAVPGFLLALLGLAGQGPREGDVRWYVRPSMTVVYRVGGVVMLIVAIVLASRS